MIGSKVKVLLDSGHGGMVNGKYTTAPAKMYDHGDFIFYEGVFNRQLTKRIAYYLEENNIDYEILVPEEADISLSTRVRRANSINKLGKCVYLSIHGNAAGIESANGVEVWTSPGQTESDILATCIHDSLREAGLKMRNDYTDSDPDKESRFYVLVKTDMPAVLVEYGFFTNKEEALKMLDPSFQDTLAKLTVKGIKKYLS